MFTFQHLASLSWVKQYLRSKTILLILLHSLAYHVSAQQWTQQGSSPSKKGQVENIQDREVAGAIRCLAPHPSNPNILYVGAVRGGIWKSENATNPAPQWKLISLDLPSHCIGALEFDYSDASFRTLIAGIGQASSFGDPNNEDHGIFRTISGEGPWTSLDTRGVFRNHAITSLVAEGNIVVVATVEDGIWRTDNLGTTWTHISGDQTSGLPAGSAYDMTFDPSNRQVLYSHAGNNGIFKSTDFGVRWGKVNHPLLNQATSSITNLRLRVGNDHNLFVATVGMSNELSHLLYSPDDGMNWQLLDLPHTIEFGMRIGIHPGRQGDLHLSLATDPVNHTIVYIGGDRQISLNELDKTFEQWPNSLGAEDYSGRLFRVDASLPQSGQSRSITHSGTSNNSSPHADSRDLAFDANGNLLEADDGGVFRRTSPSTSTGNWLTLNANLNVAEMHSVDWDANMDIIISGAQDIGTPQQEFTGGMKWENISTGDGGDVAVDDVSSRVNSIRYSSSQHLQGFRKTEWTTGNRLLNETYPGLLNTATGRRIDGFEFVAPIRINRVNGSRLLIGSTKGLYESLDQANTVTRIETFVVNGNGRDVLAYGASDNADIIYAGSRGRVYIRKSKGASLSLSVNYTGAVVSGITLDPDNSQSAFVIDQSQVFHTTNTGGTWTRVTANLSTMNTGRFHCISFINTAGTDQVVLGTDRGVFVASGPTFNSWSRLGTGLPSITVLDLEYDSVDRVLVAGTMGMGAWIFQF